MRDELGGERLQLFVVGADSVVFDDDTRVRPSYPKRPVM